MVPMPTYPLVRLTLPEEALHNPSVTPVGNRDTDNVPDVILSALVVSVVAEAAKVGKSEICDFVIAIAIQDIESLTDDQLSVSPAVHPVPVNAAFPVTLDLKSIIDTKAGV